MTDPLEQPAPQALLDVVKQLTDAALNLEGYGMAYHALRYVVEKSEQLECRCSVGKRIRMHEDACPIGYAINCLSELSCKQGQFRQY